MEKKACLRSMILERERERERKEKEKEKKGRKRLSIPPLEESLICRKIFGERTCDTNPRSKSLVNGKRTCASTDPAEYSGLEDRNCVNHPLFSFHIQITLAKLRYLNHFVVSARIYQVDNSRRLSLEKKRMRRTERRRFAKVSRGKRRKQSFYRAQVSNRWCRSMFARRFELRRHSRWNFDDRSQYF